MNAVPDSIIVNSCQFTPVYLIQDPGAPQGQSYFLAQSTIEEPKPISDNLKSFYESSGNLDNSFVNVNSSPKPRILKKQDSGVVGNNLKLASFLLPKQEIANKQQYIVNSVVLKPNVTLSTSTHTSTVINTVNNPANNTINNSVKNSVNNPVNNTVTSTSTINTIPKLNIDSKIVKLKDTTFNGTTLKSIDGRRYNRVEKVSPKIIKPKEIPPILQPTVAAPPKNTSVQLLKLGETYHSLNELSDEQMKMVTQALKIFSNTEKAAVEPAYDPVTNTQFIYKVVSPKDLTVVRKKKIGTKERKQYYEKNIEAPIKDKKQDHIIKTEIKREIAKDLPKRETIVKDVKKEILIKEVTKKENCVKDMKKENVAKHEVKKEINAKKIEAKLLKQRIQRDFKEERMAEAMAEAADQVAPPKVTRSGRKVKLPKISFPFPQKAKKKNINFVSCFQCAMEFPSLYRLQKHYETHPTHIPVKMHSNLFHCLLAILKGGTDSNRTNMFIQQLEQLIVKLRSLLPCLLKSSGEEGKACTISEDVGRLLGVSPGKYHLDMEALNCVKNKDGQCNHGSPSPIQKMQLQDVNSTPTWLTIDDEDVLPSSEVPTEDCARINSVKKWPTVNKRVWKQKQQKTQENVKRMRLASENCDTLIELGMEDMVILGENNSCLEEQSAIITDGAEQKADGTIVVKVEPFDILEQEVCANIVEEEHTDNCCTMEQTGDDILQAATIEDQTKKNYAQFHSAHFDIRSSPIKPTSTIFRKFQINPELLAKYEAQIIRSIETVDKDHDRDKNVPCPTVEEVLQTNETVLRSNVDVLHHNENVLQTSANILNSNRNVLSLGADILNSNENVMHMGADIINNEQNNQDLIHTNKPLSQSSNVLHIEEHALQTSPDILCGNENVLQTSQEVLQNSRNVLISQDVLPTNEEVRDALVNDDTLQEMFRDEDLSAVKECFILDRELKDWILNRSNDEKSEDGFSKPNSLIQPALLHIKDDEIKPQLNVDQKVDLPDQTNDHHDDSSVFNFLDTLAADCLSYPGTEIRTNCGDFQIDLFSFHSS